MALSRFTIPLFSLNLPNLDYLKHGIMEWVQLESTSTPNDHFHPWRSNLWRRRVDPLIHSTMNYWALLSVHG
jgi:hypothetical protein